MKTKGTVHGSVTAINKVALAISSPLFVPFYLFGLSILIGIAAGIGAVVFRDLIAFFHNVLFLGKISVFYDASLHTPQSPWGAGVIFVPILGAIGVTFLVTRFAPEAKGHGVPEVMDSIYYNKGIIRPIVAVIKPVASALSIGSGGIVVPILFVGASSGALLGEILGANTATFSAMGFVSLLAGATNTPIAASILALELFGPEFAAYAGLACVISFLMPGHRNVHPTQVLAVGKSSSIRVETGRELEQIQPQFQARTRCLIGTGLRVAKAIRKKGPQ
jgi:CIC family chloride channel protein